MKDTSGTQASIIDIHFIYRYIYIYIYIYEKKNNDDAGDRGAFPHHLIEQ
jgi:hypothetical protein